MQVAIWCPPRPPYSGAVLSHHDTHAYHTGAVATSIMLYVTPQYLLQREVCMF